MDSALNAGPPGRGEPVAVFETVAAFEPSTTLVYLSRRGRIDVSWSIVLRPDGEQTRVLLRLRLGPVRRIWLAATAGELLDLLTIAGLAAGLRERLASPS